MSELKRTLLFPVIISVIICGSFAYLYPKLHPTTITKIYPIIMTDAAIGMQLPEGDFIDSDNHVVSSSVLKQEKAVIVAVASNCSACADEVSFLKTVVEKEKNVKFYGLLVYSDPNDLFTRKDKYPFKVLYDRSENLKNKLGIDRTPIKIFCDHGVIKKVWVGSTTVDPDKKQFTDWLASIS